MANRSSDLRWMLLRRLVRNVRFCCSVVDDFDDDVVESGNGERRDDDVVGNDNRPPPPKNRFVVVAVVNVDSGDDAKEVKKWLLQLLYVLLVAPR